MQRRITKREVDAAQPASGRDAWVWDTDLKGFGLRVRPNGLRVYLVEYRAPPGGRAAPKRRLTIGRHGSPWTPETARKEAWRILSEVGAGKDPAAAKRTYRGAPTVADLSRRFLSEHVELKRRPATAKQYARLFGLFINPAIGAKKVVDVTRHDIMRIHGRLKDTPYQANRVLALVSTLFNFAELIGERPAHSNPARGVERYTETARERLLSTEELAAIGEALRDAEQANVRLLAVAEKLTAAHRQYAAARAVDDRKAGSAARRRIEALRAELRTLETSAAPPQVTACIRLLLFTGARLGEILNLKWEFIDLERAEARLPESKTGPKTVHLPAPALGVLKQAVRIDGNPYVIFGEKPKAHFVGIQRPWQRIREAATVRLWLANRDKSIAAAARDAARNSGRTPSYRACLMAAKKMGVDLPTGLADLRIHDLRHAYASVAAGANLGLPVIGKLLGHTQAATTQRYAHLAADPLKAAAAAVAGKIARGLSPRRVA